MENNRIKRQTVSDVFCDTYIEMDPDPRRGGYVSIARILSDKRYHDNPKLLFVSNALPHVFERNGFPVHKVRTRFCQGLRKCGDNVCRLRNILNQVFTDEAIKFLFQMPNIWLLNNNYLAKKKAAHDLNEHNRQRKMDPKGSRLHAEVSRVTANRSASAHARYIRSLQLG